MEVHELHNLIKGDLKEIKTDVKGIKQMTYDQEYRLKDLERSKQNIVKVIWTVVTASVIQAVMFVKSRL